nr:Chain B, upain-1 [synthetic construct]
CSWRGLENHRMC